MHQPISPRRISFALAILITVFLTYQIVQALSFLKGTASPEIYLNRIALCLSGYFLAIIFAWKGMRVPGGIIFSLFAIAMMFFAGSVAKSSLYGWFLAEYAVLCFLLYRLDENYENQIGGLVVDREKQQNEMNDLSVWYKTKGEGISILFEKYSTYYHLRKFAEGLTTSLSVKQLSQMIVKQCAEFIPRGDVVLLAFADPEGRKMSVIASQSASDKAPKILEKQGDLFDIWVVRNRKRLIVNDAHQDFRFDISETMKHEKIRSLIIVPLLYEGRVIGTLRIHASRPENFSNDDLRLLDAIGGVASTALSNAKLYEKTEELAIRDSLTGLYLRRFFYQRLKDEHRRVLLTHRPLSLLICDLDHFKNCNDRYGHTAGDLMLIHFSEILKENTENAVVARYGGEEFAVLLPEVSKQEAAEIAEKIRQAVEESPFIIRREKLKMTVSIGVSSLPDDTLDLESLVQKSDRALYDAKRKGRNKVCLSKD